MSVEIETAETYDLNDTVNKGLHKLISPNNFRQLTSEDVRRYQIQALGNNLSHRAFLGNDTATGEITFDEMEKEVKDYLDIYPDVEQAKALLQNLKDERAVIKYADDLGVSGILYSSKFITHIVQSKQQHFERAAGAVLDALNSLQQNLSVLPRPRLGFATTASVEDQAAASIRVQIEKLRYVHAIFVTCSQEEKEPELPR